MLQNEFDITYYFNLERAPIVIKCTETFGVRLLYMSVVTSSQVFSTRLSILSFKSSLTYTKPRSVLPYIEDQDIPFSQVAFAIICRLLI
jgi:hypothetical protein